MAITITIEQCICCGSSKLQKVLLVKDYTVSNENFEVWECGDCTFRFTQNIPTAAAIGAYYKSDAYVSHSNTNKGLVNKLYHSVRKITLRQKLGLLKKVTGKKIGNLLDIGAGTGAFAHTMQTANWQVVGLEPDAEARANALKDFGAELLPLEALSAQTSNSFDAITLWHVLEHVHELKAYLQQFHELLLQNGRLIIAVPNYTSADAHHYGANWAAYDVPRHLHHFSPKSMEILMQNNGFEVVKKLPMWFDSVYVSMLSEQYKNGKGNILSALYYGLESNLYAWQKAALASSIIYIIKKQ